MGPDANGNEDTARREPSPRPAPGADTSSRLHEPRSQRRLRIAEDVRLFRGHVALAHPVIGLELRAGRSLRKQRALAPAEPDDRQQQSSQKRRPHAGQYNRSAQRSSSADEGACSRRNPFPHAAQHIPEGSSAGRERPGPHPVPDHHPRRERQRRRGDDPRFVDGGQGDGLEHHLPAGDQRGKPSAAETRRRSRPLPRALSHSHFTEGHPSAAPGRERDQKSPREWT